MHTRGVIEVARRALADTPVVLIHGARQTGKSTLARAIAEGQPPRRYLTLDDAGVLSAATTDPQGFLAGLEGPVVLDEVQRAPGLFPAIKAAVDRDRTPGRFLLTGSANVLLLPRISESLAGRVQIVTLWPLSQGEIQDRPGGFIDAVLARRLAALPPAERGPALPERVARGGFPEPLTRKESDRRSGWFGAHLTTILQRDVRDLANIDGLTELPRLLKLLASRVSGLLNFADLSRGLSIPQTTLKRYFSLLETTFLVVLLPAWSASTGLRLTKSPKILLADTGLAADLLGLDGRRLAAEPAAMGPLLENFVALELLKQAGWSRTRVGLFHFRTANGRAVDIVLEDAAGRIVGIEVKSAATPSAGDFAGLHSLREAAGERFVRGVVLYGGQEAVAFGKDMHALPVRTLWDTA